MEPDNGDLRGELLAFCDAIEGARAIPLRFKFLKSLIRLINQQRRETGQVAPKTASSPPRQPKWQAWADWLVAKIASRPDICLRELQVDLRSRRLAFSRYATDLQDTFFATIPRIRGV